MKRIYVASSWRNDTQPEAVRRLRAAGFEVYDFREPAADPPGSPPGGFQWSRIDARWQSWDPATFRAGLEHPLAEVGFGRDFGAMQRADACLMVQPCGVSAALELGWFVGRGRPAGVLLQDGDRFEAELMLKMADALFLDLDEAVAWLERVA